MNHVLSSYQSKFIITFSLVGILSTLTFGVYVHLSNGNTSYALFELFLVLIATFNLFVFHYKRNYELASNVILILMVLILSFLLYTGGHRGTGLVWVYTFPLLSFFLKDHRSAFLWNLLLIISAVLLLVFDRFGLIDIYYDYITLRQAFGAYLAVMLLSFFYSLIISRLIKTLQEKAVKDPLTGLYNRAFTFETLSKLASVLSRSGGTTYCLIYIDLDNFKKVNDTYGHETGDKVLVDFANLLSTKFRKGDVIGRFGGDEFVIIAHNCNRENLEARLEELRREVEKRFASYRISLSYGVVEFPSEGNDPDVLIYLADSRMYEMKRSRKE